MTASLRWTLATPTGEVALPDVLTSTLGLSWGEATGGELTYPLDGTRGDTLAGRLHDIPLLRAHITTGETWTPIGGDLLARQVETDRHAEAPTTKLTLVDAVADTLDTVTLWPKDGAPTTEDGNRLFTAATPGAILATWLQEAHARGEATYVNYTFTAERDSHGAPWVVGSAPLEFATDDKSLLAVLKGLWASGMCDWTTAPGGELVVTNPALTASESKHVAWNRADDRITDHDQAVVDLAQADAAVCAATFTNRVIYQIAEPPLDADAVWIARTDDHPWFVHDDEHDPRWEPFTMQVKIDAAKAYGEAYQAERSARRAAQAVYRVAEAYQDGVAAARAEVAELQGEADDLQAVADAETDPMEKPAAQDRATAAQDAADEADGFVDELVTWQKDADGGGGLTVDRSAVVVLHAGADVGQSPQSLASAETAHVVRVVGDDGTHVVITDPELPVGPTGKRSVSVAASGVSSKGALTRVGRMWIEGHNRAADHLTRELVWEGKALPFRDYGLGDHITAPGVDDAPARARVSEITLATDGPALTGDSSISLNGKYTDALLRVVQGTQELLGAVQGGAGSGSRPTDDRPDRRTPAAPEGLFVASEAYTLESGEVRAVAAAWWAQTRTDVQGVAMTVDGYRLRWRTRPTGRWHLEDVDGTTLTVADLTAGGVTEWQVRTVGPVEVSEWSAPVVHTAAHDDTPPPVPSAPTVAAEALATSVWTWDGYTADGGRMPLDTDRVELAITADERRPEEVADSDVWAGPQMRRPLDRPQSVTIAGRTGTMYGYLRSVDTTGNASEWTSPVGVEVRSTVDVGEIDDSITDAIADADARIDQITNEVVPGLRDDMTAGDQAAQDAAAAAATAAATAQETADDADAAAAAAAGRATVVRSVAAPDDTGVLWLDGDGVPHVWDGEQWVVSTDQRIVDAAEAADDARGAADAAQAAADAAQQAAEDAQSTADLAKNTAETARGRSTVAARVPVTTDGAGKETGSVWWVYDSSDRLLAGYRWDGSAWKAMPLSETILPKVAIGQGTYGELDGARLKANTIATEALAVTDLTDLVVNGLPADVPDLGWYGGRISIARGAPSWYINYDPDDPDPVVPNARVSAVTDATPWALSARVVCDERTATIGVRWTHADGENSNYYLDPPGGSGSAYYDLDGTITPPDGAVAGSVWLWSPDGPAHFQRITARRQTPGVLIADGAVTAAKVVASNELTAKVAEFLKVKSGQVDVNDLWSDNAFLGLARANTLQIGDIRPTDLPSSADELIRDPLWFDADRRAASTLPTGWSWQSVSDYPGIAVGGQQYTLHGYTPSLDVNNGVSLIAPEDAVPVTPGEVVALELTAYHAREDEGSRLLLQAVFTNADGQNTFSADYATSQDGSTPSSSVQTTSNVVTVPDGATTMWVRVIVDYLSGASSWWKVLRVSARKGMASRTQTGGFEVTPQNLTAYSPLPEGGIYPRFNISATAAEDVVAVRDADGEIAASMTADGSVTGTTVESAGDMVLGGRPLAGRFYDLASDPGLIDRLAWGIVQYDSERGWDYGSSPRWSQETGFALMEFSAEPNRMYRATIETRIGNKAGESAYLSYRTTTSDVGNTPRDPNPTDSQFGKRAAVTNLPADDSVFVNIALTHVWRTDTTPQRVKLLAVAEPGDKNGADVSVLRYTTTVEDIGPATKSTGRRVVIQGSGSGSGSTGDGARYTTTWNASGHQVYSGDGTRRTAVGAQDLIGGKSPAYPGGGNQRTFIEFAGRAASGDERGTPMRYALKGATVESVRVRWRLHSAHQSTIDQWARGTSYHTAPSTLGTSGSLKRIKGWSIGQTRTDSLPADWFSADHTGLILGPSETTDQWGYGRVYGSGSQYRPQVTITYRR